ncbi:UDP-galactopyranose mutase [Spirochaetia bacterium]|nr:UDP-galactopyranose mutase [Spirochaetia bacterium]
MVKDIDTLVVGCGLCGSVIARFMAETCGLRVRVIERRNHIGGNMYDFHDENGILTHLYGPHTFHTNQNNLYAYMTKYGEWEEYHLTCMAYIDGKYTPSPFNFKTIDDFYPPEKALQLKERIAQVYSGQDKATIVEMLQSDDALIKEYADFLYEKDYSLYTAKQWGISPSEIDVSVLKRVPVLFSYRDGYFDDTYQVMPKESYTHFFENLLNHQNIKICLNADAREHLTVNSDTVYWDKTELSIPVIFTGAIDELLEYKYGALPYRSLRFDFRTEQTPSYQDAPVVAYPQAKDFTRITEYTKLPVQKAGNITKIAVEYPLSYNPADKTEPYYPILTESNLGQYDRYKAEVERIPNLYLCGRLADYKYYNMDQALARVLEVIGELECDRIGGWL